MAKSTIGEYGNTGHAQEGYKDICGKCGAKRIDKQIGLEQTPEEYIAKMVEVFQEVRRVLHPSGTFWINLGDSYSFGGRGAKLGDGTKQFTNRGSLDVKQDKPVEGYKSKNLLMVPFRVAIALQNDGWWLRSVMPWVKRNSMPESVTDRPTTAVEYMFLLAKNQKYYFDNEAVRVTNTDTYFGQRGACLNRNKMQSAMRSLANKEKMNEYATSGRNFRNSDFFFQSWQGLWEEDGEPLAFIVNPQPFKNAHFATFPERLVEPCIKAGTSEKGCCPECGEPWVRVIEKKFVGSYHNHEKDNIQYGLRQDSGGPSNNYELPKLLGWRQNCGCEQKEPVKCVVLDPFMGAGTVAVVAKKLFRNYIGIELNPRYVEMSEKRIEQECGTIF